MWKIAGAALVAMLAVAPDPAQAQQRMGAAPRGHTMKVLNQRPLTLQEAKNAIDALLLLREKYKDYNFKGKADGPAGVIEAMKNSAIRGQIEKELKRYGFSSIEDWVAAFVSAGLAVSYVKRNANGAVERRIQEIESDPNLPEDLKRRLVGMIRTMKPPKENEEVAQQLLNDSAYAEKIRKLMPSRGE